MRKREIFRVAMFRSKYKMSGIRKQASIIPIARLIQQAHTLRDSRMSSYRKRILEFKALKILK